MWCIGFPKQWPLNHAEVLYSLKSASQSENGRFAWSEREDLKRDPAHSLGITSLALEGFGVLPAELEQVASERMRGQSSESGFPDKWRKTERISFLQSTKSLGKWRIHLPILLWSWLSQKLFVMCKPNDGRCHSTVEWCLIISEFSPKKTKELSNSSAKNSPVHMPWEESSRLIPCQLMALKQVAPLASNTCQVSSENVSVFPKCVPKVCMD